jgi:hypothetical protein
MEQEPIVPKIVVKTLTDKTIKIDYTDAAMTLDQLKAMLVEKVELPVERQFFVLSGVALGREERDSMKTGASLLIAQLPGFKTPEALIAEFKDLEEQRLKASEQPDNTDSAAVLFNHTAAAATALKHIEDLLPTLYLFHYEPLAMTPGLDPLELATDWSQKNRLKFFKGIWALSQRRLQDAAKFLVDALPTFEETGFMPFKEAVKCTVIAAAVSFDRPALKAKVNKPYYLHV